MGIASMRKRAHARPLAMLVNEATGGF